MTYATQPGTIPHRVVEFLKTKPPGFVISTADLSDELSVDHESLTAVLATVRMHGLLKAERQLTSRMFNWSLGDGSTKPPQNTDKPLGNKGRVWKPRDNPLQGVNLSKSCRAAKPAAAPKAAPRATPASTPFRVGRFSDGTMTIQRGGFLMELSSDEATVLHAACAR